MTGITPPELHGLLAIAREEGLDMKPVLLRVLTDLYISTTAHSSAEAAQFQEIAGTLSAQVDLDTALIVACKLAAYPATPLGVAEAILARQDDSSRIMLADARWLPAPILIEVAAVGDRVMAAAVAARADLDPDLIRLMLGREDPLIDVTLAANTAVSLPPDVRDLLLDRARQENAIALALLARSDLTGADRAVLFMAADRASRRQIIEEAEKLASLSGLSRRQRIAPPELAAPLETAAMSGDRHSFSSVLALALGTTVGKAREIASDRSGEPLALALITLGISDEVATRIFMFLDPLVGHSSERVMGLVDIVRRVSVGAADRIITAVLGSLGPARQRTYVPQSDGAQGLLRGHATSVTDSVSGQRRAGER